MKNTQILTISQIKRKAVPVLKKAGVRRASIFGSYARGEARKRSDVDILIDAPRGMGLFELVGLEQKLEEALEKKVQVGTYNGLKERVREEIMQEQVPILVQ